MKNKINTENFEVFYLDYLEGNLDADLTLALFAFLAQNPKMQVEDLGPELSDTTFILDNSFKNNLKQNQNTIAISASNVDYFLTADKEQQLSEEKTNELNLFVASHPEYQLDRKIYSLTNISADKSIVYPNKKNLKHRETLILWPYISFLAAACAVLIVWIIPNSGYDSDIHSAANIRSNTQNPNRTAAKDSSQKNATKNAYNKNAAATKRSVESVNQVFFTSSVADFPEKLEIKKIQELKASFEVERYFSSLPERKITAITYQSSDVPIEISTALAMKNPVKPITNKLSDMIKTQVDYQTGENNVSQRKGFYLKIGQLEIYQNKKKQSKR
jgi:hypothetical protein